MSMSTASNHPAEKVSALHTAARWKRRAGGRNGQNRSCPSACSLLMKGLIERRMTNPTNHANHHTPEWVQSPKLDSRDQGSRLHSYYLWNFGSTMHSKWKRWANKTGQSCLHSLPADGWWKATQAVLRQPWPPTFSGKCSLRVSIVLVMGGNEDHRWRCPYGLSWALLVCELLQAPQQGME